VVDEHTPESQWLLRQAKRIHSRQFGVEIGPSWIADDRIIHDFISWVGRAFFRRDGIVSYRAFGLGGQR
jgi:hypothetical protein